VPAIAPIILLSAVGAVVVGLIVVVAVGSRKQREQQIAEIFAQSGLVRERKPFDSGADARWVPFASLPQLKGGAGRVTWCASGAIDGHEVVAIEHRYVVSTGQVTAVVVHTCVACRCPDFWPAIELKAEHLLHRLADRLGASDLEVESERFNRRWRVSASDTDLALAILTPEVQAMLEDAPRNETWSIGLGWIRVVRKGVLKPEDLAVLLRRPGELLALVPAEMLESPASEAESSQ